MKNLMKTLVLPKLASFFQTPVIYHKLIKTVGIGESFLADKIKDWEASFAGTNAISSTNSGDTERTTLVLFISLELVDKIALAPPNDTSQVLILSPFFLKCLYSSAICFTLGQGKKCFKSFEGGDSYLRF